MSHVCFYFLKEKTYTLFATTSKTVSKRWLWNKKPTTSRTMILRTLKKMPRIKDNVSGCRLKPARQWWYHRQASHFEDEVRVEEEEAFLKQRSQGIPPHFSPVACCEEIISTDKAITFSRNEDGQTYATMTGLEPSLNTPAQPPLLLHIRFQERETPHPNSKLDWSDLIGDQTNRSGWSKNPAYPSWQLSLVVKTDVSQWAHHNGWHFPAIGLLNIRSTKQLPSSILFLYSTGWKRRKTS